MPDERITAYLLGELTARAAEQFEEQCFAQNEWPAAALESAEEDLVDAYSRKEFTRKRRQHFEKNYLTTAARKERVMFARSFLRIVCSNDEPAKSTWTEWLAAFWKAQPLLHRYATVVMVLIVGAILLWHYLIPTGPRTFAQLTLTNVVAERRANEVSTAPIQTVKLPLGNDALRISL